MVKRIDKLSAAQIARMPEWRDRWIKTGLSCEPTTDADRAGVTQALRALYQLANLKQPTSILFVPSPLALRTRRRHRQRRDLRSPQRLASTKQT